MSTEELEQLGKMDERLGVNEAVEYLKSIGMQITAGHLRNRLCSGKGPACKKVLGRLRFKKADLDSWKRQETEVKAAYSK